MVARVEKRVVVGRSVIQRVALDCALATLAASVTAAQAPIGPGSWTALLDWSAQLSVVQSTTTIPGASCFPNTIGHAALVPTGVHRGKVLLWNVESFNQYCQDPATCVGGACDVTKLTWLFDPASPSALIELRQTPNPFTTNIFCSGTSWDADGNLIVAGGEDIVVNAGGVAQAGPFPKATYRFLPGALSSVQVDPPPPLGTGFPFITASAWTATGDMGSRRNYPTVMLLGRRDFLSDCPTSPFHNGAGSFVLGGRPAAFDGNEIWDFLDRSAPAWSCAFRPALPVTPYPHPFVDHTDCATNPLSCVTHPTITYAPKKAPGQPDTLYPDLALESYPRAFQISNGEIVIAGDRDKAVPPTNTAGLTWVLRPHYATSEQGWELRRLVDLTTDRQWGSAVLMHTRVEPDAFNDRVLVFGGTTESAPPTPGIMHKTVQEFVPGSGSATAGSWTAAPKADTNRERWTLNATTLPTGHIFIHGGEGPHGAGPAYTPEIYDPGRTPTSPSSSVDVGTQSALIPRRQHHVALLLPDARVLIAGGDYNAAVFPPSQDSRHNGAIYSPWYLEYGFRPLITRSDSSAAFNLPGSSSNTFELKARLSIENSFERVVLIRPGAVTHHLDSDQRYMELAFEVVSESVPTTLPPPAPPPTHKHVVLDVTAPYEGLGPPGWYMVFVIEKRASDGALAPSVATFIDLQ